MIQPNKLPWLYERLRRSRDDKGSVLIVAIITMGLLVITSTVVAAAVAGQAITSHTAQYSQQSSALAKSALNYVYAELNDNTNTNATGYPFVISNGSITWNQNSPVCSSQCTGNTSAWFNFSSNGNSQGRPTICPSSSLYNGGQSQACVQLSISSDKFITLPTPSKPQQLSNVTMKAVSIAGCSGTANSCTSTAYQGQLVNRTYANYVSFTQYETMAPEMYSSYNSALGTSQWSWTNNCNTAPTSNSNCVVESYTGNYNSITSGAYFPLQPGAALTPLNNVWGLYPVWDTNQPETWVSPWTVPSSANGTVSAVQLSVITSLYGAPSNGSNSDILVGQVPQPSNLTTPDAVPTSGTVVAASTTKYMTNITVPVSGRAGSVIYLGAELLDGGGGALGYLKASVTGYYQNVLQSTCTSCYDPVSQASTTSPLVQSSATTVGLPNCPSNAVAANITVSTPSSFDGDTLNDANAGAPIAYGQASTNYNAATNGCAISLSSSSSSLVTVQVNGYFVPTSSYMTVFPQFSSLPVGTRGAGNDAYAGASVSTSWASASVTNATATIPSGMSEAILNVGMTNVSGSGDVYVSDNSSGTGATAIPVGSGIPGVLSTQVTIPVDGNGSIWYSASAGVSASVYVQVVGYTTSIYSDNVSGSVRTNSSYISYCGQPQVDNVFDTSGSVIAGGCGNYGNPTTSSTGVQKVAGLQLPSTSNVNDLQNAAGPYSFPANTQVVGGTCPVGGGSCSNYQYAINTVAGNGSVAGQYASTNPNGVATDSAGNIYAADPTNHRVLFEPAANGVYFGQQMTARHVYDIAGNGTDGYSGNNIPGPTAALGAPVAVATSGSFVYVADSQDNVVWAISSNSGNIIPVAGNGFGGFSAGVGYPGYDQYAGPATQTELNSPEGVAVSSGGNLYIADTGNNRILFVPQTNGTYYGQSMVINDIYEIAGNMGSYTCGGCDSATYAPGLAEVNPDLEYIAVPTTYGSDAINNITSMQYALAGGYGGVGTLGGAAPAPPLISGNTSEYQDGSQILPGDVLQYTLAAPAFNPYSGCITDGGEGYGNGGMSNGCGGSAA